MDALRQKFDPSNLYEVINNLPTQISKAWQFTSIRFDKNIKKLFIFGVGGSALPANIVKTFLLNSGINFNLPIKIIRDYNLPSDFDSISGGIFISYSGNTEETLNSFNQALKTKNPNIIALSTGGTLKEMALKNNIKFVNIPNDVLQPRMAYGYFFGTILKILVNSELLKISDVNLNNDVKKLLKLNPQIEKNSQKLAVTLKNKIPIIYTSDNWKYLAMIIKINFNENSKIQSFWNAFPELNHNEMVGYTKLLADYKILIFRDPKDQKRNKMRMDNFKKILGKKIPIDIIEMPDENVVVKIFFTLMTGLWTSYYLALIYGIDPVPVTMVEDFKKLMKT